MTATENLATGKLRRARLRKFLLWLANVDIKSGDIQTIQKTMQDFGEFFRSSYAAIFRNTNFGVRAVYTAETPHELRQQISDVQAYLVRLQWQLRQAWQAPTLREQRRAAFRLSEDGWYWICDEVGKQLSETPPLYPFEQAVELLLDNLSLAKVCDSPSCSARYFFANRRSQKRCSSECDLPFRKVRQLKYWNKTGNAKRKERRQHGSH